MIKICEHHVMSDSDISRFHVPTLDEMPDDIRELIKSVSEKSGFVPNVFVALAPDQKNFGPSSHFMTR